MLGNKVGKYLVLEKIAAGGMGEVYLARNEKPGGIPEKVAIKFILPQYSTHIEFQKMFIDEAKVSLRLSHPNLVQVYEYEASEDLNYIVMEYVEGLTLRRLLRIARENGNSFSTDAVLFIGRAISEAIHCLWHAVDEDGTELKIVKRDVSPPDIMLGYDGRIKLLDLGIAKHVLKDEFTRPGTLKGKFGYMSPEQAEGEEIDTRSDVFSLGIVLWELLAQQRLFGSSKEIEVLELMRDCRVPQLTNVAPEIARVVHQALEKEPDDRFQDGREFAAALLSVSEKDYGVEEFSAEICALASND